MSRSVKGTVVYQNLGMGFWGIETDGGEQLRPVNMPEQLKYKGKKVQVVVQKVEEEVSMFMWGTAVRIVSFSTLMP